MDIEFGGTTLKLLDERVIYWPETNSLLLSDWHVGKSSHFRRHGLALPEGSTEKEIQIIEMLLQQINVEHIYVLGDVFHSGPDDYTVKWWEWAKTLGVKWTFVVGNHDQFQQHTEMPWVVEVEKKGILMVHHPPEKAERPTIAGHWHPGVRVIGRGKRQMTFPCFLLEKQLLVLPSFGLMTGAKPIKRPHAMYYALTAAGIHPVKGG